MRLSLVIGSLLLIGVSKIHADVLLTGTIEPKVPVPSFLNGATVSVNGFLVDVTPNTVKNSLEYSITLSSYPQAVVVGVNKVGYVSTRVVERDIGVQSVSVVLVREALPTSITFPLTSSVDLTSSHQSAVRIKMQSGTCAEDASGNAFNGTATVYLNFFHPEADDFRQSPGLFRTVDSEEQLESNGVFQLRFTDAVGNAVHPRPLNHTCGSQNAVPDDPIAEVVLDSPGVNQTSWPAYTLWKIKTSGMWEERPSQNQSSQNERHVGTIGPNEIGEHTMMNIGIIEDRPKAYVKVRVFTDSTLTNEVNSNSTVNYRPDILLRVSTSGIPSQSALLLYSDPTTTPATVCHELRLSTNGTNSIRASIALDRFQDGTVYQVTPVELSSYPPEIKTALTSLNYDVAGMEIGIDAPSSASGPFYTNQTSCENDGLSNSALWFFQ